MKTEQSPTPAGPITLSVNAVVDGKWFAAGEPLPFKTPGDVPEPLQPFIAVDELDEPQGPPGIRFELNRIYNVDEHGAIITPHGRREAARLAGEAAAQAQAEADAEAAGELPPETQAALEDAHAVNIGLQIKTAEVAQARRDAAYAQAQEAAEREAEPARHPSFT